MKQNSIEQLNNDLTLSGFQPMLNKQKDIKSNLNIMNNFFYRLDLNESKFKNLSKLDI